MDKLDKILQELSEIKKEQAEMSLGFDRVERVLKGDSEYKQSGLVHKVAAHNEYIKKARLREAKRAGIFIGISVAWTAFWEWIKFKWNS